MFIYWAASIEWKWDTQKKEVPLSSVYLWLWWVIPFRLRNETPFVFMIHFHCRALSLCSHITVWSLSQNEKNFFSSIKLFRCISRDRFSSNLIFFENWNIFFFNNKWHHIFSHIIFSAINCNQNGKECL